MNAEADLTELKGVWQEGRNTHLASQLQLAKSAFRSSHGGGPSWEAFLEVAGLRQKVQEQTGHCQELER